MKKFSEKIVSLEEKHITDLLSIQNSTRLSFWSSEDYKKTVDDENYIGLVEIYNSKVVGFIISRLIISKIPVSSITNYGNTEKFLYEAEVLNLAVLESEQNRGFGSNLLQQSLVKFRDRNVQSVWLEVRESNVRARKFYKNHSFNKVYTRRNYYSNPVEDAMILKYDLENIQRLERLD